MPNIRKREKQTSQKGKAPKSLHSQRAAAGMPPAPPALARCVLASKELCESLLTRTCSPELLSLDYRGEAVKRIEQGRQRRTDGGAWRFWGDLRPFHNEPVGKPSPVRRLGGAGRKAYCTEDPIGKT